MFFTQKVNAQDYSGLDGLFGRLMSDLNLLCVAVRRQPHFPVRVRCVRIDVVILIHNCGEIGKTTECLVD